MSDSTPDYESDDARLARGLDLLVDGQLDEAQRRALLSSLEERPDGWRRCALAFLEAQCWQEALGSGATAARQAAPQGAVPQVGAMGPSEWVRARRWQRLITGWPGTLLAMAACFLLALGLGMGLRTWWLGNPAPVLPLGPVPQPGSIAGLGPEGAGRAPAGPGSEAPSPAAPRSASAPLRWVTLCVPSGPDGEQIAVQMPALEQEELDAGVWEDGLARPPREVVEALRRLGIGMQRRRELVPLEMPDGHQLVLPVEEVQFHYVGSPAL